MTFSPIKTAVVGYGFSAKTFHIPFITSLEAFEFVAVSTSKAEVAQDWPNVQHFTDAVAMLTESDAELVIITAPNSEHFPLAKLALEKGKHVIIEKPFVTNVQDGQALIDLAKRNQCLLSVYHNRRWDGDFLTVKSLIEEGRVGDVKHFESHFDRFRPEVRVRWREQATDGGGILFDLGSHLIDQALELFGLPEAISAHCKMLRPSSTTVDYFNVTLHYPNRLAVLHGDMFSAGPNHRFTVKGTQGSYEKYGLDPQESQLISGMTPEDPSWGQESEAHFGRFYHGEGSERIDTFAGQYQTYFEQMASAIRHNTPVPVTPQQALVTIRLIELAMESSRLGQTLALEGEWEWNQ